MAKRDVNLRFLQAEQEYLELTEILSDLKKDLDDGKIDLEWYSARSEMIAEEVEKVKAQYFFWAEAEFELKKPNRKSKEQSKADMEWYKTFQSIAKDVVLDDSKDVLKQLKALIQEGKIK